MVDYFSITHLLYTTIAVTTAANTIMVTNTANTVAPAVLKPPTFPAVSQADGDLCVVCPEVIGGVTVVVGDDVDGFCVVWLEDDGVVTVVDDEEGVLADGTVWVKIELDEGRAVVGMYSVLGNDDWMIVESTVCGSNAGVKVVVNIDSDVIVVCKTAVIANEDDWISMVTLFIMDEVDFDELIDIDSVANEVVKLNVADGVIGTVVAGFIEETEDWSSAEEIIDELNTVDIKERVSTEGSADIPVRETLSDVGIAMDGDDEMSSIDVITASVRGKDDTVVSIILFPFVGSVDSSVTKM